MLLIAKTRYFTVKIYSLEITLKFWFYSVHISVKQSWIATNNVDLLMFFLPIVNQAVNFMFFEKMFLAIEALHVYFKISGKQRVKYGKGISFITIDLRPFIREVRGVRMAIRGEEAGFTRIHCSREPGKTRKYSFDKPL